ncbi:MAG: ABC transporter, partial [Calditrichaeota bacterium]|nr:ABC transporter [Calditrichota bacterium]
SPVNFLIMDEPTNHLDIASQEALEQALREYNGTLLLISHDRYFLDRLVSRVFELKDGRLRVFEGNYSEYLNRREGGESTTRRPQVVETSGEDGSEKGGKKSKEQKRQEAEARQAISKQRKELQNKIDKAEREIESMEARKGEIEALLANPETYNDGSRSGELQREYIDLTARLERVMARWEGDQEALEELLSGLPGE